LIPEALTLLQSSDVEYMVCSECDNLLYVYLGLKIYHCKTGLVCFVETTDQTAEMLTFI
jgi:hypothetical protein